MTFAQFLRLRGCVSAGRQDESILFCGTKAVVMFVLLSSSASFEFNFMCTAFDYFSRA